MNAPIVFISYSHDSPEHKNRILALSQRLRKKGIDCKIDQYEQSPAEGWPLWCERQVERSDYVLVACTETYLRRFRGEEAPGKGRGGTWEGHVITQELYNAQGNNTKFMPITFCREDAAFIPLPLQSATAYQLDDDYELLYRRLSGQPLIPESELGSIEPMPPQPILERKQDFEPLWQVRHRRNVFFTGREKVLADLRQALEKRGIAALAGLGGVGKTQTAVEYAYRYREHYRAVFWAKAESRETLLADFVSIAALLNLPSAEAKDQELAIADVRRWLDANPGWLLILDNADDLPLVQGFLPNHGNGHVLLTTQVHAASALAECVHMEDMQPEEGALLLLRRAGVIAKDADRLFALQLSKEMGGLPLALDQAGAFIEETHRSLSEYAELYASEKSNLLAERGTLGDHPSVTVTFSIAFEKVAEKNAAAADLLRVCAFLAPDAIPEEIFTKGASELGENLGAAALNKLGFARIIGEAARFSLLDRDAATQTLGVHRLVQIVIKAGMSKEDQRNWAERTVRATEKALPYPQSNWALCQKLISHAQTCATLIRGWNFGFVEAATLLNKATACIAARALFDEAEPRRPNLLPVNEKAQGTERPDFGRTLYDLAELYNNQRKYEKAEPLVQQSLRHDPDSRSLNNRPDLDENQLKYVESESLVQRSLAFYDMLLNLGDTDVAFVLNEFASLYYNQGKYGEAEPMYKRSLVIREKALGPNHHAVATALNNLGLTYYNQGKHAEAEPLFQRALAIYENTLGPDHINVATSLNNLAFLYDGQGGYTEAKPLYERSLAIKEKTLGPDHPSTKLTRSHLDALRKRRTAGEE